MALMTTRGWHRDARVIVACCKQMRAQTVAVHFVNNCGGMLVDIVGTGGDGHDTFNASTTAAMVAACCGLQVAKHGNKSSSGKCGSSDLMLALDVSVDKLEPSDAIDMLKHTMFTYLYAPTYHPALMRYK